MTEPIRLTFEVELEPFTIGATSAPAETLAHAMISRILGVAPLSYDDLRYRVKTAKWVDDAPTEDESEPIDMTALELESGTGILVQEWSLDPHDGVSIFADGTVNATLASGETVYELAAGNPQAKLKVAELYRRMSDD